MRPVHSVFIALSLVSALNFGSALADTTGGDTEDSYPHVTQLETYILGQTHVGDSLQTRLGRMEQKAFGAASTNPDLSARTDALDDYADQKLGKKTPVATDDTYQQATYSDGPADAPAASDDTAGSYPHITALEKEILGQAYPQDELPVRIARMETKAFGAPSTDPDLSNRTDALDKYAEKTLHKKSFDKQQAEQAAAEGYMPAAGGGAGGGGRGKALLNFAANQLLGMAMPIPSVGQFGGVRMRPADPNMLPENEAERTPAPEDPAIFSATPPPAGSHLITQVGWCEMRIFGHTSPQLHLVERLEQLNGELNYAPAQRGTELMDDVPKLMQVVSAREHFRPQPQAGVNTTPQ